MIKKDFLNHYQYHYQYQYQYHQYNTSNNNITGTASFARIPVLSLHQCLTFTSNVIYFSFIFDVRLHTKIGEGKRKLLSQ